MEDDRARQPNVIYSTKRWDIRVDGKKRGKTIEVLKARVRPLSRVQE